MGPVGFQDALVYLRTAVGVGAEGWARFDYVEVRSAGDPAGAKGRRPHHSVSARKGEPVWQEVPASNAPCCAACW